MVNDDAFWNYLFKQIKLFPENQNYAYNRVWYLDHVKFLVNQLQCSVLDVKQQGLNNLNIF